ncbi:MAG: Uroporphyrin-III C/tetrapyrrole (Corrin/Porphyrin) methyltransferase [Anaeromyxobacteraceae bacterium]|jgi:16S rRNA (cytidine1402-2'-O)-methyltransferase|nr:Uroporphyrin-III C/tetrapyrrole (Corrin/Porphyrin) methyltransferase [Anaeromyxobacteraceae bacterium]
MNPPAGAGTLYVVATPIGNLGDLSPRAAEVLRTVDVVVAEDTRRTRTLLAHVGARPADLLSLPAFDEEGRVERVVSRLAGGASVALVTDAGTPGVSDPGTRLVEAAWGAGAKVVPVPGPSAALAALSASGLAADRFLFAGFLPRKGGARAEALRWLSGVPATVILFEAGNRAAATLEDLETAFGDRPAALARELTKLHEEMARGSLSQLRVRFAGDLRGEVTLVIAGAGEAPPEAPAEPPEEEILRRLAAGEAPTEVARAIAKGRGVPRGEAYAMVERVRGRR